MNSLSISLVHCYGIKKLKHTFDFTKKAYSIYAPNGTMKTSFAKTLKDLSEGSDSKDLMFPERETVRKIEDETGTEIEGDNIFTINPYDEDFKSDRMSTLLANKELREKYDNIHLSIVEKKDALIKELKKLSGLKNNIEEEVSLSFTNEKEKVLIALDRIEKEVLDPSEPSFSKISFKIISNDKVATFLNTKDFKEKISEYIQRYDKLIDSSTYFKKGVFNHNNASTIAKNLKDNGFFEARHSVSLNNDGEKREISTEKELTELIEQEKNAILTDPDLIKAFEEIDSKLKANKDLRDFRDYLLVNMEILPELNNINSLKQKLWIDYLKETREEFVLFIETYHRGKDDLEEIIKLAKEEKTSWLNVIEIFNKRFTVPFVLEVQNQDDVILNGEIPSIKFVFKDSGQQITVEKTELLKALSNGEKRALYILNIIFEVEARKKEEQKTLFIIDDIADSFDYKNKYAIIEYLKEISEHDLFYQIILTHNFDFFRTIESRFIGRKQSLMIVKNEEKVELIGSEYLKAFSYFKSNLHKDNKILVASIPFARNLIEYTKSINDDDYKKLTSILHIKSDSDKITIKDIENIFNNLFDNKIELQNNDKSAIDLIFEIAEELANNEQETVNLENKIVLSIAIRLKAEKFMINNIKDKGKVKNINKNQTPELFRILKEEAGEELSEATFTTLGQVNLMTPENIHFNSFMYEPILDMSDDHLRQLHSDVSSM